MKPVEIKGVLDVEHQIRVERWKNGEKGVDLVAPFYTHLDKEGRPCGILVNRGWMPWDLRLLRHDRIVNMMKVSGVLYRGDAKTKYSKANVPLRNMYTSTYPEELALMTAMPNESEAGVFMLKAVDFDTEAPTALPDAESPKDLQTFAIAPERHAAYASLWNYMTYLGVVANTAVWLYL